MRGSHNSATTKKVPDFSSRPRLSIALLLQQLQHLALLLRDFFTRHTRKLLAANASFAALYHCGGV
jgi:hypothetical protein